MFLCALYADCNVNYNIQHRKTASCQSNNVQMNIISLTSQVFLSTWLLKICWGIQSDKNVNNWLQTLHKYESKCSHNAMYYNLISLYCMFVKVNSFIMFVTDMISSTMWFVRRLKLIMFLNFYCIFCVWYYESSKLFCSKAKKR